MIITIENHGPLIVASNYWQSVHANLGKVYCSVNAGTIRVLVPQAQRPLIAEARKAQYAILSRGPWPEMGLADAVEILWEDGSDNPFAMHLSPESFDLLPAEPEQGREWTIALWDLKKRKPHRAVERKCHWRRVPQIPWLKPWEPR